MSSRVFPSRSPKRLCALRGHKMPVKTKFVLRREVL